MNILLDTNILLIYNRSNEIASLIEQDFRLFDEENNLAVSVVSIGEIKSILYQSGVGEKRIERLEENLNRLVKIGIDHQEIIDKYVEIDAFSQGRHKTLSSSFSARNMGKNDLWIAATASALDLTLVTTDKDFDHLAEHFIKLETINLTDYSNQIKNGKK